MLLNLFGVQIHGKSGFIHILDSGISHVRLRNVSQDFSHKDSSLFLERFFISHSGCTKNTFSRVVGWLVFSINGIDCSRVRNASQNGKISKRQLVFDKELSDIRINNLTGFFDPAFVP